MPEQLKYDDITHKIIGCAMRVHTKLGNGFQEVIYQRSLEIEIEMAQSISFEKEKGKWQFYYRGVEVGTRRVDFFVEDLIMVELKALIELEDVHLSQGLNYLEAYNVEVGLLLNFGSKSLTYKRLLNKKFKQQ